VNKSIDEAKELIKDKTKAKHFIAYFQSFTNTYAPVSYLNKVFSAAISRKDIVAISIATRPDCLPEDVILLLAELNKIKPVWVELGLQTTKDDSVEYIRRLYPNSVYEKAVKDLSLVGIEVITHIIIGLPKEEKADVLNTLDFAVKAGTKGVKLQLLHVLKETDLYADYKKGAFKCLSLEEYLDILFACIKSLPKDVVIHRLTGDAPKAFLVEPLWSADKKRVINTINKKMEELDIKQGSDI